MSDIQPLIILATRLAANQVDEEMANKQLEVMLAGRSPAGVLMGLVKQMAQQASLITRQTTSLEAARVRIDQIAEELRSERQDHARERQQLESTIRQLETRLARLRPSMQAS